MLEAIEARSWTDSLLNQKLSFFNEKPSDLIKKQQSEFYDLIDELLGELCTRVSHYPWLSTERDLLWKFLCTGIHHPEPESGSLLVTHHRFLSDLTMRDMAGVLECLSRPGV